MAVGFNGGLKVLDPVCQPGRDRSVRPCQAGDFVVAMASLNMLATFSFVST